MSDNRHTDRDIHKSGTHQTPSGRRQTTRRSASASGRKDAASGRVHTAHPEHGTNASRTSHADRELHAEHLTQAHHTDQMHRTGQAHHAGQAPHKGHTGHAKGKQSFGQKFKHICNLLWTEYRFETIAVSVLILAVIVAVPLIISSINKNKVTAPQANPEGYGELFTDGEGEGQTATKAMVNEDGVRVRIDESTGEEVEDPTVLAESKQTGEGYLNHCIFLGDSRFVGLVSYAVISDEDVLAQVGIAHPSVENFTFTQNSGKQYTLKSYLASNAKEVIYIGYGVNGMKGADEATYEKQYKTLVEHIMEMAPNSKVVLMSIWPVDDEGTYKGSVKNEWIEKYNEFLVTLAEYEGIYYLDVASVLKNKNGGINPAYDGGDGLHYNSRGYDAIRSYILSHPVPGIPVDGEYKVHYVPPTGQFRDMVKDKVTVPTSAPTPTVAHEHVWEDDEIVTKATCTEPGLKKVKCSCGATSEREIAALGHKYGDDGTAEFCSRCGAKNPDFKGKATPTQTPTKEAHTHEFTEKSRKDATCSEDGYIKYNACSCGETKDDVILPATGNHNYENGKCKVCGASDPNYNSSGEGGGNSGEGGGGNSGEGGSGNSGESGGGNSGEGGGGNSGEGGGGNSGEGGGGSGEGGSGSGEGGSGSGGEGGSGSGGGGGDTTTNNTGE